MDRLLLSGAVTLLIIEVALLLGDLGLIPLDPFHLNQATDHQQKIGSVLHINQNVRRKPKNSLIWENSENKDSLYAFDSILTLSNSSAKVELNGNIQLQLHENTLVVLEPIEGEQNEHLRLKFARGTLRSRANKEKIDFESGELVIEAGSNSDINLRSVGQGKVEVEVAAGEVKVDSKIEGQTTESLSAGEKILFDKGQVLDRKLISEDLSWDLKSVVHRLYSHQVPLFVHLRWQGQAHEIRLVSSRGEESVLKVSPQDSEIDLPLYYGTYFVSLINGNKASPSLSMSLWPAEKIYYLAPLPRNRVDAERGDTFSWSGSSQAQSYHLQLSDDPNFHALLEEKISTNTQIHFQPKPRGPLYWRIVGEDEEGTLIPAFYHQIFYSVLEPLDAPTLILPTSSQPPQPMGDPRIRRQPSSHSLPGLTPPPQKAFPPPKTKKEGDLKSPPNPQGSRGSPEASSKGKCCFNLSQWIWRLLFPQAEALENLKHDQKSVTLSWYPVAGADFYIIEISPTPDFQLPLVIQKIAHEQFSWKPPNKNIFYWRVAAGQNSGRMGLFSPPAELNPHLSPPPTQDETLNSIPANSSPSAPSKVAVPAKVPDQVSNKDLLQSLTPKESPSIAPKSEPPQAEIPLPKSQRDYSFRFSFNPEYVLWEQQKDTPLEVNFKGWSQVAADLLLSIPLREKGKAMIQINFASYDWKRESQIDLPFQEDFKTTTGKIRLLHVPSASSWAYGLALRRSGWMKRTALESLSWDSHNSYGGSIGYFKNLGTQSLFESSLWFTLGSDLVSSEWSNRWDYSWNIAGMKTFIGLQLNLLNESHSQQSILNSVRVNGILGCEW